MTAQQTPNLLMTIVTVETEIPMTALVSGFFALLGAFFGAWLSRRTEYVKWLRQERSIAFSKYLLELHQLQNRLRDILYDRNIETQEKNIAISESFSGLNIQKNIVRLYLESGDRKKFSVCNERIWDAYRSATTQSKRLDEVKTATEEIQTVFEKVILK